METNHFELSTITTPARRGHMLLADRPETTRTVILCNGTYWSEAEGMTKEQAEEVVQKLNEGYLP